MSAFDLPLAELRAYRPDAHGAAGLRRVLGGHAGRRPGGRDRPGLRAGRDAAPRRHRRRRDVLRASAASRSRRWLLAPAGATGPLPTVVEYLGYGGGRSLPFQWLQWAAAGYAHLVMDTRGQGSSWSPGDTPDLEGDAPAGGGNYPGFVTRGIGRPETLVLPPADHGRGPRGGRRAAAPARRRLAPRGHRQEPGRRAVARGRRACVSTSGRRCPTCRSSATGGARSR